MSKLPFMQVYVGELLSTTSHLSLEQRGGCYTLLFAMWNAGGFLPNDPVKLARICGVSLKRWTAISPDILAFFDVRGDRLTQERLLADYQRGVSITEKRRAAGAKGNEVKSLKSHQPANANASAKTEVCDRISESDSKPESEEEKKEISKNLPMALPTQPKVKKASRKAPTDKSVLLNEFKQFWSQYPKHDDELKAEKAYIAARRGGKASAAEILAGALRYSAEKADTEARFIKTAGNWLEAGSWKNAAQPPRHVAAIHSNDPFDQPATAGFFRRN